MEIIRWIVDKYFYIVGLLVVILAWMEVNYSWKEKRRAKAVMLILVFISMVAMPVYNIVAPVVVVKEEFSTARNNISYSRGMKGNMILKTEKDIEEPIDLRIKDTWSRLVYLTDYNVRGKRGVFINYEFGNSDTVNKGVAQNGLVFTYKTRIWR